MSRGRSQVGRNWRQRRMQSGDVQQLVDDDERLKWSRRQSSTRPADRSMTAGLFIFSFVLVKTIVFRFGQEAASLFFSQDALRETRTKKGILVRSSLSPRVPSNHLSVTLLLFLTNRRLATYISDDQPPTTAIQYHRSRPLKYLDIIARINCSIYIIHSIWFQRRICAGATSV